MRGEIQEKRLDTIFDGIHKRKTAEEIGGDLKKDERKGKARYGMRVEEEFQRNVCRFCIWAIEKIEKSTNEEDHKKKIDFWITTREGDRFPVQVKSNNDDVVTFKNSSEYTELHHKKITVIASPFKISKSRFKKQFFSELNRLRSLN